MIDDWLNQNPNDGFDPNDHGIEMNEIAKLHAMADMQETWAREQANKFYNDFETLDIKESIIAVTSLIRTKVLNINQVNIMLDNMIKVFTLDEEYEKCHIVNEIKKGLSNDRI